HERPRGATGQDMAMSTMDYARGVEKGGGIPVNIPVINEEDYIDKMVEKCDGLLFSGGPDISPYLYGAGPDSQCGKVIPARDEFELKLLEKAIEKEKPVLGICRGAQLINVSYNGTLKQHIDDHRDGLKHHALIKFPRWYKAHDVEIKKESHIFKAYKKEKMKTNSLHHQAIKEVGDGLTVTAKASDGIVEGVEDKDKDFLVGVQWHPEMMYFKHEEQVEIFKYFIENVK
ncbi:MAG TPA: gamma-glutamyl-gamma-aminobutyrate hydrolase family protein, partial [Halanaerobiales bacterium]|nr:gamma-glutamyl-gamma-aminobutyrate hydrolase family protein [Halanaerobiales bacterium]